MPGFVLAVDVCTAGTSVTWTEALSMTLPERVAFLRTAQRLAEERAKRITQHSPSPRRQG